jgi:hypothetical protein
MLSKLLKNKLVPYRHLLIVVVVFQAIQSVAGLYLPTLNADIINKGIADDIFPINSLLELNLCFDEITTILPASQRLSIIFNTVDHVDFFVSKKSMSSIMNMSQPRN